MTTLCWSTALDTGVWSRALGGSHCNVPHCVERGHVSEGHAVIKNDVSPAVTGVSAIVK